MTNREWLDKLTNKEYAEFQNEIIWCDFCKELGKDECYSENCKKNIEKWLESECKGEK